MTLFLPRGAKLLSGKEVPSQGPILENTSMDSWGVTPMWHPSTLTCICRRHCDVSLPQVHGAACSPTAAINRHHCHAHASISSLPVCICIYVAPRFGLLQPFLCDWCECFAGQQRSHSFGTILARPATPPPFPSSHHHHHHHLFSTPLLRSLPTWSVVNPLHTLPPNYILDV